ncbi:MAG: DNA primase [Clostridia bacterium]|nr:DNA primase [Clostridia bacterium]
MIRNEVLSEVLARTEIEGLISGYVTLRRAGSNLSGLCPFHSEKTPSFTVFPATNSFYCFGCGAGGDPVTFVRRVENLDFEDAVEFLAKRAGITVLRDEGRRRADEPRFDRNRFYAMNRDAARFFHSSLFADTEDARAALAYFKTTRGLSDATIKHFGLGYAPNSFDALTNHLLKKGYTEKELVAAYLCGKSEKNGKLYDSFRNRVMFPIIDVTGNVIAFGGRVMDDSKPKYKNTSDTPVFKKSRHLFALNYARHTCAERLILCEGYMDVIALHVAGFTNAVATLGTAITAEQARIMSRYTKKVIITYDNDEAGQCASDRAIKLLEEVGVDVQLLRLSGAKDPDEYIRTFGKEGFAKVLDASRSKFEYSFERVLSAHNIAVPQERIKALMELCGIIAEIYSSAQREVYISEVGKRLQIEDLNSIRTEVERMQRRAVREKKKNEDQKIRQNTVGYGDRVNPDFAKDPGIARKEEAVLGLLMLYAEHRAVAFADPPLLTEEDFFTAFGRRVFAFIRDAELGDGFENASPDAVFTPEEVGRMMKMKLARMQLTENGEAVFRESAELLRLDVAERRDSETVSTVEDLAAFLERMRGK